MTNHHEAETWREARERAEQEAGEELPDWCIGCRTVHTHTYTPYWDGYAQRCVCECCEIARNLSRT